jgi:hypothetical protein
MNLCLHLVCRYAVCAGELRSSRAAKGILLGVTQGLHRLLSAALPSFAVDEVQWPLWQNANASLRTKQELAALLSSA